MKGHIATQAREIAQRAHAGQRDKNGAPYIAHPERVAARVAGDDTLEAIAWLHDVVEDTDVSLADLAEHFPPLVVAAVDALTRRRGEDPDEYYVRVRSNEQARIVKNADIDDNTDPSRTGQLPADVRERLREKYAHARAMIRV